MCDKALIGNLQDQLCRLVEQLKDIEEEREELDSNEYDEMKASTMEELQELSMTLEKMTSGDVSVIDEVTSTKMAVRAAISQAFRTPEVMSLFAKKQPAILRQKLFQLESVLKMNKIDQSSYTGRKVELLLALKGLKDPLSADEEQFLATNNTSSFAFEEVSGSAVCKDSFLR